MVRNAQQKFHRSDTDYPLFPGPYDDLNQSYALQNYTRRRREDDPWSPANPYHAYGQRADGANNGPHNSPRSNSRYDNLYSSSPVNDPYNDQYNNNSYGNNPYTNNPYNNNNTTTNNNNPGNDFPDVPPYANRNGRVPNGDSNNSRSNNTYPSDYDTTYGRRSHSEHNRNNTSSNRSRNNSRR